MLPTTSSLPATSAVHTGTADCNDNMSNSRDVKDYSKDNYGLSYEDDDLYMNRTDCGKNIAKSNNDFTTEHDDGLSNFESDDDVEYDPSSDNSSSSEEGNVGRSTARVFDQNLYENEFNVKEGNKIVLKIGQLFENVDKFRQVLQDFIVQQGNVFVEHEKLVVCLVSMQQLQLVIRGRNIEEYCDDAFSKDKYLDAHKHILHLIVYPKIWKAKTIAGDPIQPPPLQQLPSRPRKIDEEMLRKRWQALVKRECHLV
ncbi:hypothetical protein F0562_002393 [Nyssa sinensis]|uniref:Uncharacterized protein n=1 Tax=Nyssa sinensis TaxID=561372 RepID=A0A5J5C656_9ASTE|nr:hypothetical protein F0562_002393 [Nyssa sinensis]